MTKYMDNEFEAALIDASVPAIPVTDTAPVTSPDPPHGDDTADPTIDVSHDGETAAIEDKDNPAAIKAALWRVGKLYLSIIIKVALFIILLTKIIMVAMIPTSSMYPTCKPGELALGNRLAANHPLERGDIIVFYSYECEEVLSKRVVGLPGEQITFFDGQTYINGEPLDEPYLPDGVYTTSIYAFSFEVPEGHYFVMGDNRDHSFDSRYWNNPYVSQDDVLSVLMIHGYIPIISDFYAGNKFNSANYN